MVTSCFGIRRGLDDAPQRCLSCFCFFFCCGKVSLALLHGRASHIIWPPDRWQRIRALLPPNRAPLVTHEHHHDDDQWTHHEWGAYFWAPPAGGRLCVHADSQVVAICFRPDHIRVNSFASLTEKLLLHHHRDLFLFIRMVRKLITFDQHRIDFFYAVTSLSLRIKLTWWPLMKLNWFWIHLFYFLTFNFFTFWRWTRWHPNLAF